MKGNSVASVLAWLALALAASTLGISVVSWIRAEIDEKRWRDRYGEK